MKNFVKKNNKVGVIIQARMGSTRLPGKVMLPLMGESVLYRVVERILDCKYCDEIVIATTKKRQDDSIVQLAQRLKVGIYRGSEENVLSRYYEAAKKFNFDIVIRITADCPLIDPQIIDEMIQKFNDFNCNGRKCDYLSSGLARTFPLGIGAEIFWYDTLCVVFKEANKDYQREHVTPFIRENPHRFQLKSYTNPENQSQHRWTLDEKDDYNFIRKVYEHLYPSNPKFRFKDILNLLKMKPELISINAHVKQKLN